MPSISGTIDELSGAVIDLFVGVDGPRKQLLEKHGLSIPRTVRVRAQIDTGSGVTAIDPGILGSLDLRSVGTKSVITPSTGAKPHICNEYIVGISLVDPVEGRHHPTVSVIESVFLQEEGIQALLGRDLLAACTFLYEGQRKEFTFSF
jgi:hypothetical protein